MTYLVLRFLSCYLLALSLLQCTANRRVLLETELLKVENIGAGVFVHTSYLKTSEFGNVPCNGMVYTKGKEAIIFDTPTNDQAAEELMHWLSQTNTNVIAVVVTHFHEDCLGGLKAFHSHDVPSYALPLTIELAMEDSIKTLPSHLLTDEHSFTIGGESVVCRYFGAGHTKDNVVGYVPVERVLFGGCLIKQLGAGKGNLADADVAEWPKTIKKIKIAYPDAKIVIPGHGRYGDAELLDYTIKLFTE